MDNKNSDKELGGIDSLPEEGFQDDHALLSGEPFSIKSHWKFKARGWFGVCFSIAIVALAIYSGKFEGVFIWSPAFLLTMSVFLLLMARTSVYIDQNSIVIIRALGRYQIKWSEIQKIVFDTRLQKIVFYGLDKWLVMPKIVPVASGRRFGVAEYVNAQVRLRKIPIDFSDNTPEKSKNTMVSIF
jgi:hypothetical protein